MNSICEKTIAILITAFLSGCSGMMNARYPITSFWVTNSSNKTVYFKASVIKFTSMGPQELAQPFSVNPGDTVLFRRAGYQKDANPVDIFSKFIIFPVDSVQLSNPSDSTNWIKSFDDKGRPQFIFDIHKNSKT